MRAPSAFYELFILMLVGAVALATILPAQGQWQNIFGILANAAIALLFFLHGAKNVAAGHN